MSLWRMFITAGVGLCIMWSTANAAGISAREREDMVARALSYLFSAQKEGSLGEKRKKAVTSLFVMACLSSGIDPDHPKYGKHLLAARDYLLKNSSGNFLGGQQEPYADHAIAGLMLSELIGTQREKYDMDVYRKADGALRESLKIQTKGLGGRFYGGWCARPRTRTGDRAITAWFLMQLRSASLRGIKNKLIKRNAKRAKAFILASQKTQKSEKKDEYGGFSVDAEGLPVLSATAAGLYALSFGEKDKFKVLARDWLLRHPPRWYGPRFFRSNFFALRGLYRLRLQGDPEAFDQYFAQVCQILKERQLSDGRFPFPPGHPGPVLSMGEAYSTAMAILLLNVDRGLLPIDQ